MTAKIQTTLSAILILIALVLNQNEAIALGAVDDIDRRLDATIIASPIGHANIRVNSVTVDVIRHLEEKNNNTHRRKTKPFFYVLLASLIVNIVTFVSLLSLIPVLTNSNWSFFKSVFWVANDHIHAPIEVAKHDLNVGGGSLKNKVDKHAHEQETATLLADIFIPSFACGVILATTLFLVIPEAILFIQRGTSSDKGEIEIMPGTIARFGAAIMTGYMLPLVLGALFPRSSEHICTDGCVSSSDLTTISVHKRVPSSKIVEEEEKYDEENLHRSLASDSKETIESNEGEIKGGPTFESKTTNAICDSSNDGHSNGTIFDL